MKDNFEESSTRLIVYLLIANAVISAGIAGFITLTDRANLARFVLSLIFIPGFASLLYFLKRGYVRPVKLFAVTVNFGLILLQVWLDGGVHSPDFFNLLVGVILATLGYGLPGLVVTTILSLGGSYAFSIWQVAPRVYSPEAATLIPYSRFLTLGIYFYFSIRLVRTELDRNLRLNEELTRSEARIRDLIMKLPLSGLIVNYGSGAIELVNERLTQVLGYAHEDLQKIDDWFGRVYGDPKTAQVRQAFWRQNALGEQRPQIATEMELFTRDHERRDFEAHARWLGDDLVVLLLDVTDRKQAEKALRASEEKFRAIIEQSSEAILIFDEQGRIVEANQALEKLTGLPLDEIIGTYFWDMEERITPPEQRSPEQLERIRQMVATAFATGDSPVFGVPTEVVFMRTDGERRTALNWFFLIRSESGSLICTISLDMTDRKRAEEILAKQEARILETEQNRLKTLETIENISFDLRKADEKKQFYTILLEKCIQLLGAVSGLVYEYDHDAFHLLISRGLDVDLPGGLKTQLDAALVEFSSYGAAVKIREDVWPGQTTILVKLVSERRVHGFLVLFWQAPADFEDIQTILQTLAEIGGIGLDRMRVLETLEERVKDRTRELRVLYDIMQLYVSNDNIEYVIQESLQILKDSTHYTGHVAFVAEGESFRLVSQQGTKPALAQQSAVESGLFALKDPGWEQVISSDKPVFIRQPLFPFAAPDGGLPEDAFHWIGVPVRTDRGLLGVIGFAYSRVVDLSLEELNLINLFSDQIGVVIERNILRQQVKSAAIIEERQRLSRELHDSLTQSLYSLKLISDAAKRLAKLQRWDDVEAQLNKIFDISMQSLKEMRLLVYELVPESIEQLGLAAALEQRLNFVERRSGVAVEFIHEGQVDLPQDVQVNLYRIAQEALNNATKHSAATKIEVRLTCSGRRVLLQVSDNGTGFELSSISPGMGLKNMEERARRLGCQLTIDSRPGSGTVILCALDG
jgi:PAS domain S-box-containing protein